MKPAPFDYVAPTSVEEACKVLADAGGGATIIAGGQTLMPLLNLRMSQPFVLVDINKIAGLSGISSSRTSFFIGPTTRQCELAESALIAAELPALHTAVNHVGHHQTRNRGTVGGSIALGEPAAELPACAVALDAEIELASQNGTRMLPADEFYLGPYMTAIQPDELVSAIAFPAWPQGHIPLFGEVAQRPGDFALTGVVGALVLENGVISRARLCWFAMGPTPVRARKAEDALIGQSLDRIDPQAIAELALTECAPFDDHHASADYRRVAGRKLLARVLAKALNTSEAA